MDELGMSFKRTAGSPSGKNQTANQQGSNNAAQDKISTQCAGGFACQCDICTSQVRVERRAAAALTINNTDNIEINEMLYEGISRDFFWLMHSLLPTNDKVKGCELIFPDTAFFKKGKPVIVIKSDTRDFCLQGVKHPKKLSLQSIYKDFQNVVRRRKKDFLGPFGRLYFPNNS